MRRSGKTIILRLIFCIILMFIFNACAPKLNPDKWIFLGTSNFDERRDTANIRVGESEGVFSRLRFEVSNALELNWVFVYFEDGERWSPNEGVSADYKPRRGMGRGDQEFDLPDGERVIKRIEFRVTFIGFNTSAGYVKVYGLKEVNSLKETPRRHVLSKPGRPGLRSGEGCCKLPWDSFLFLLRSKPSLTLLDVAIYNS